MSPDDDTGRGPIPLGPVGGYVIANLAALRAERRLTYKDLSDRLDRLDRPIPTLGLSRIEKGKRRVDADDLVALALALGVSPVALLLPRDTGAYDEIELTSSVRATARAAWEWSAGNFPLVASGADPVTWREIADFEANARPAWHGGPGLAAWRDDMEQRRAEMEELRRKAEAAEAALRAERARNGHAQEEAQPVVAAIVTSPRGVLVGRRIDGKPPWTFIAGEDEPGERLEDTAIREVKEETTLRIEAGDIIGERVHPKTGRTMIYLAAPPAHGTEIHVGDEDELAEVRWVGLAEADELLPGMFESGARVPGPGARRGLAVAPGAKAPQSWRGLGVAVPDHGRRAVGDRASVLRHAPQRQRVGQDEGTAQQALRDMLSDAERGELVDPCRQPLGAYLDEWLDGLRLAPSTVASYRKNIRLHVAPCLGDVPLAALTTERINRLYRELERSGRADHREGEGLSPRTVRYVHTILSAALAAAVKTRRLARNPAADA